MRLGIVGGGLMGKEIASAVARWFALDPSPGEIELVAVCDSSAAARDWFRRVPGIVGFYERHDDLLAHDVDAVYLAVPHMLHEALAIDCLRAGKDLLAEKPFGIDLAAANRIQAAASGRFVRISSEFPFFPGVQAALDVVRQGRIGTVLQVRSAFLHSSDLDPNKPINWKRQSATCGEIGVMGDLGLHVCHVPFRLGFEPLRVFAQLQNVITERPDGRGGVASCDTWDNATLHTWCAFRGQEVPVTFETKRMAPGEMNTWALEVLGTEGGVRFSTKYPKTLWAFERPPQRWVQQDVGHTPGFPAVTGPIFEFGFPDSILQMLAAFVAERNGTLGSRFGCATPEEAVASHRLFDAALRSQRGGTVETV